MSNGIWFRKGFQQGFGGTSLFTKLLLLKVVLPLLILATALGLAPFPWAKRLRARIRFGTFMRRLLILVFLVGVVAYGVEFKAHIVIPHAGGFGANVIARIMAMASRSP